MVEPIPVPAPSPTPIRTDASTDLTNPVTSISFFVAGWRPTFAWVCIAAFAYIYLIRDMIILIIRMLGYTFEIPQFGVVNNIMEIVIALLGLTAARSVERIQGVARDNISTPG